MTPEAARRHWRFKPGSGTNLGAIAGTIIGSLAGPALDAALVNLLAGAVVGLIVGGALGYGADVLDAVLTPRATQ